MVDVYLTRSLLVACKHELTQRQRYGAQMEIPSMPSWSDIDIPIVLFPENRKRHPRDSRINRIIFEFANLSCVKCVDVKCVAGRPTKLTPELQQGVVEILRNCGTRAAAAGRAHIHWSTFVDWMRRGEQATSGRYYDFFCAVRDAEAQAELMATRTVRLAIVGGWHKVPMRDKDGNYVFKRNPRTGEILRDAQGRPEAELVDEYKEPDAKRAAWFLERRDPANWGKGGGDGVTLNVSAAPKRPEPNKREFLDLLREAMQILADNGMDLSKPKTKLRDQKAIEITATLAGSGEKAGA